ncbi:MAG: ATP-dependent DNA helicase [Gammaproteobacteria bacterium]|nr:ATP-dependent DNA helicase [Gammaproteobacteria bacterium]
MAGELKLGVRELVEFCCRSGDLGYDNGPSVSALDGLRAHQEVQQRYADSASAEYAIAQRIQIDDSVINLGGRIDLVFADDLPPRIEEIKTVYAHRAEDSPDSVHWAQLKCYGACYALARDLDEVVLSLNRVALFSRQERRQRQPWRRDDLVEFLRQTLRSYLRWYRLLEARRARRRELAQALEFPFADYRHQQRRFAAEVYRAIRAGRQLTVEAPTGAGKTVSTLFPAVKAIGEDLCDQIVYLSAKVSGQQQAVDTIELLHGELSYAVIQAKARACPCNENPAETDADGRCLRCLGFFDRLPAAREQLLQQGQLDVARVQATAARHQLCPFELTLQMLPWVDVIVCDFNYVFDPLVQLGYFREDSRRKVLLIDELHNLVDRARGMYSATLSRRQVRAAEDAHNSIRINRALAAMQRTLDRELRAQADDENVADDAPAAMLQACQVFAEKLGAEIFDDKRIAAATLEFSKAVFRFQHIGQLFGPHHRALSYRPAAIREVRLLCLNALDYLRACYPLFSAVCGFSATLSPPDYFQRALGLDDEAVVLQLEPPFPPRNLAVRIADYVDLRYRERERYIDTLCASIAATFHARPGNYLVFFSSYHFMQQVHEAFVLARPEIDTRLQQRDADETAQREFLEGFFDGERQLGFAIMGGRFAEGIDYRGDALIGAMIVGVGLPQAGLEQQLIQQDFDSLSLDGFDYAFRYPGLIRVLQSAGRVIRSERDRGVVVLFDRRFRQSGYARHLPAHWQIECCNAPESLEESLASFWQSMERTDGTD